jgi:hypothetical protein
VRTFLATALIVELDDCQFIGWETDKRILPLMSVVANDTDQTLRFDRCEPGFGFIPRRAADSHCRIPFSSIVLR